MNRKGSEFLDVGGVFSRRPQDVAGLERAERLEGREGWLYKGGVLIIKRCTTKPQFLRYVMRLQMSVGVPRRINFKL